MGPGRWRAATTWRREARGRLEEHGSRRRRVSTVALAPPIVGARQTFSKPGAHSVAECVHELCEVFTGPPHPIPLSELFQKYPGSDHFSIFPCRPIQTLPSAQPRPAQFSPPLSRSTCSATHTLCQPVQQSTTNLHNEATENHVQHRLQGPAHIRLHGTPTCPEDSQIPQVQGRRGLGPNLMAASRAARYVRS